MALGRESRWLSSASIGGLVAFLLLLLNGVLLAAVTLSLARSRTQHRARAEEQGRNLARILEQNLEGMIDQVDLSLLTLQDAFQGAPPGDRSALLERHRSRLPMVDALRTADATGRIDAGTGVEGAPAASILDRPYFQRLRADGRAGLLISEPSLGRISGKAVVMLARRLNGRDGAFAGVVYAAVTVEGLSHSLARAEVGPRGSIALLDDQLHLVARFPGTPFHPGAQVDPKMSPRVSEMLRSGLKEAVATAPSVFDRRIRTFCLQRVGRHPLTLVVGLAEEDYLATWREERRQSLGLLMPTMLVSFLLSLQVVRSWRRHQAQQAELAVEKEKFQTLTETTDDVVWSILPDGTATYVSPSVVRQRGFTAEEIMAMTPAEIYGSPADLDLVKQATAEGLACRAGEQPYQGRVLEISHRRKDGTVFPSEVHLHLIWSPDGRLLGLRGLTRDISQRKNLEAERDTLIQDLQASLAEVQTLEGLLPICSHCKKIRDDDGGWKQLEAYITQHSEATFTHGICPDCAQDFFPRRGANQPQGPG